MLTIQGINEAVKMFESNGADAFGIVKERYGEYEATLLLVVYLRRSLGSMDTYPADPDIDRLVLEMVSKLVVC
jgi:hypothetical protein